MSYKYHKCDKDILKKCPFTFVLFQYFICNNSFSSQALLFSIAHKLKYGFILCHLLLSIFIIVGHVKIWGSSVSYKKLTFSCNFSSI